MFLFVPPQFRNKNIFLSKKIRAFAPLPSSPLQVMPTPVNNNKR